MFTWLKSHIALYLSYVAAPILFHLTREGYVLNYYFMILEMVDVYGIYVMVFVLVSYTVFARNNLFKVFLTTHIMGQKSKKAKKEEEEDDRIKPKINFTANLPTCSKSWSNLNLTYSPVFREFAKRIK